jgi:hypothetical protein
MTCRQNNAPPHLGNLTRVMVALSMTSAVLPVVGQNVVAKSNQPAVANPIGVVSRHPFLVVPGQKQMATLYATGEQVETEWETVWRPMCGSHGHGMNEAELARLAQRWKERSLIQKGNDPDGEKEPAQGGIAGSGLNIVFDVDDSVPAGALNAMDEVENYLESLFDDDITVHINVSFESLDPDVLGATGSDYTKKSWPVSREGLQDGMDDGDNIQNYLPAGETIPVRYNGETDVVTDENRVWWTRANFRATVGSVSGDAASMTFNSDFAWDYNPANGVIGMSFRDVLVHECGHALGFTSGADFRYKDMEALDIFRFQRTGGGHDYNPDTTAEFKIRPRLVSYNEPNDDVVVDVITVEYRMADGNPYQASHFREQGDNIGLMDPAIAGGETHFPDYFSIADLKMFDAIGYDR